MQRNNIIEYIDYENKVTQFIKSGIRYSKEDEQIERFYEFIDEPEDADESEEKAKTDDRICELAAECYVQVLSSEWKKYKKIEKTQINTRNEDKK